MNATQFVQSQHANEAYYCVSIPFSSSPVTFNAYIHHFVRFLNLMDDLLKIGKDIKLDVFDTLFGKMLYQYGHQKRFGLTDAFEFRNQLAEPSEPVARFSPAARL